MAKPTGFEALMELVCGEWCLGATMDGLGEVSAVTRFIPETGIVTADQFVEWVFLASDDEARDGTPKWQRAKAAIRAAFVLHMGGESVDAATLRWDVADGGAAPRPPLPDPVAFARNLTEAELEEYREIFGADSREWIIAQDELVRRRRPVWLGPLHWAAALISLAFAAWMLGWL